MSFNMIENMLNLEELGVYHDLPYPSNVKYLNEKLEEKLRFNQNYEVFVPLTYIRLMTHVRTKHEAPIFKPTGWFVSNCGRVLTKVRCKEGKIATVHLQNSYYLEVRHVRKEVRTRMLLQRIVASSFLVPHSDVRPEYAKVGFKDYDKENVHLSNLYWSPLEVNQ